MKYDTYQNILFDDRILALRDLKWLSLEEYICNFILQVPLACSKKCFLMTITPGFKRFYMVSFISNDVDPCKGDAP